MTTLPQEAVKAAQKAFYSALYVRMAGSDEAFREAISAALPFLPVQGAVKDVPLGAIENGRVFLQRLADHYDFTCEAGSLANCADFHEAVRCFEHIAQWISDLSALEPSAARALALEEHLQAIEQQLAVNLGYFHDEKRFLLETLQAHITTRIAAIRALSSPDHADAGKVEGDGFVAYRFKHRNDGPHMWEYYPLPIEERSTSPDFVTQALTLKKLLAILNSDQHADRQFPSAPASGGAE